MKIERVKRWAVTAALVCAGAARAVEYSVPDTVWEIAPGAFAGCAWMTRVNIPSSVTAIGTNAFHMCQNLTAINVDDGNRIFGSIDGLLYTGRNTGVTLLRCPGGKTGDVEIPNGVYTLAPGAFARCEKITSVKIPATVMNIGEEAFYRCSALTNITVDAANPSFQSIDGVLYSKTPRVKLICCPGGLHKTAARAQGFSFHLVGN